MQTVQNIFEAISKYGQDEDFVPKCGDEFVPTDAPAGSEEKLEYLCRRVERGMPLWHEGDRAGYEGCIGGIRPRR